MQIKSLLVVPVVLVLIGAGCQTDYTLGTENAQMYAEEIIGDFDRFPKSVARYISYSYPDKWTAEELLIDITQMRDDKGVDKVENILVTGTEDAITPKEEAKGMASYSRATGTFTCGMTGEPVPFTLEFGWVKKVQTEHGMIDGVNDWQLIGLEVGSCK